MENNKSAFAYDSLPPAGLKKSIRLLKSLETFPTLWWWLGLSLIIFLIQIAIVSSSFFVGKLIDHLGDSRQFQFYLVMMAVTLAIDNIGRGAILPWIFRSKFTRIATELRVKALDSTLHTPVPRLYQIGTGSIITRLTKDIDNAVLTLGDSGERLVVTLLAFPFTLVSLCIISPFYILPFFLFGLAVYIWSKKIVQFIPLVANRMSDSEARRNAFLLDAIRGLSTTKAMGLEEWSEKRTEKSSWQVVHQWYRSNPSFFWVIRRGYFSYFSLLMMVLGLSLLLAYLGWISIGEASTAVVLIVRLEIRIFMLLEFSAELQRAFTSAGRAIALANLSEDIVQPDGVGLPATLKNPDIVIKDLSFSYPSGAEVLSNLNLNLQGGTTTALVGSSGAGKSTLAVLIAGLQYPTAGSITVGGVNINTEANDAWITSHITLISQEVHLFAGTLREDLHMALPGASDVTLIDALSQAGLDPNGPL
ncbi:ATP-binding cassette domain-containing protein [Corynebacterium sp. 3HC-13]|uniref:ATP-binding cassette domain-containing protein n=1 Tax=Corynebacterium poyangense TaxID=2684405 RepID=UPI001EC188EE|nr:ATP-binding cassette domain-containing protein [Corynebacterium poyangense]